jgi:ATP-binding cassette subfamily B protein
LIDRSQKTFAEMFRQSDANLRKAQGNNQFVSQSPRYVMEALGIATIATLAYLLTQQVGGIATAFPTLAALALGLQRMLPMAQQAYNAWATIHGAHGALQDTLLLLEQPMPAADQSSTVTPLPFQRAIAFQDYSFRYATTAPWVLRGLNLCIRKGARIGFIGSTGSGKSTLLDVIMGLLLSEHCHMSVDDQPITVLNVDEWRAHIAHVPQTVFLTDNSVAANIAFGSPDSEIDMSRVRQAAVQAKIANDIESWPSQYDTFVGERGVQLSGGQRQRIGIARALYKRADVIIFDEATSALDSATESAVMQSIDALDSGLTVLIIAHRLSTLRNCDCIYKLDAGAIVLEDAQQLLLAH